MNDNDFLTYDVPVERIAAYRDRQVRVRAHEPAALVAALADGNPELIVGVRLLALTADSEPLNAWNPGLPMDLLMSDPAAEFPLLYRHVDLLDHHPVRVIIPLRPGFAKAVRVAVALNFAVWLEPGQPDPVLIEELTEVMTFYLRQPNVAQPVEFFHSTLLGFYHGEPLPLWAVLEADPHCWRYVAEEGTESLPGRLAGGQFAVAPDAGLDVWIEQALATADECRTCEFFQNCGGYFKWPRRDYACAGVKRLFGELREAAAELRRDLASAPTN